MDIEPEFRRQHVVFAIGCDKDRRVQVEMKIDITRRQASRRRTRKPNRQAHQPGLGVAVVNLGDSLRYGAGFRH